MRREDCRIEMEVLFGRPNGEKTRGIIKKLNRKTARVVSLDSRAGGRKLAGAIYNVDYTLLEPAGVTVEVSKIPSNFQPRNVIPQFDSIAKIAMQGIADCYYALEPEVLSCDGEASLSDQRHRAAKINQQLRGFFIVIGSEIDRETAFDWESANQHC